MRPTSRYWRLSDTVSACLASDRILFLDIRRDRYLALPSMHNDGFLTWLRSPGDAPPRSCRPMLAQLGVRTGSGAPAECFVATPAPIDSLYLPPRPVRIGDMLAVGRAVMSASMDVRSRPLAALLGRRLPAAMRDLRPPADLKSRLAIFRSARPFVPVRRVCLHDCLALVDWLGPGAGGITLVFGVSARPFAAHSWLQVDGEVVDDHPESPCRYQPILHLP
jgi:hypothetical protein